MPVSFRMSPAGSGAALLCAALFSTFVFAAPGGASNLKDVRVGPNDAYTRVVLETDAKTSYSLNQSGETVTIELQATATPKAIAAKGKQLAWVRVEPAGDSALVKLELRGPGRVKQMVLTGPHRIVLDVYGGAPATKPTPQPAPLSESKPTQLAPVPVVAEAPKPALSVDEDAAVMAESVDLLGPAPSAVAGDEIAANEGAEVGTEVVPLDGEASLPEVAPLTAEPMKPAPIRNLTPQRSLTDWLSEPLVLLGLAIAMAGLAVILILRRQRPAAKAVPKADDELAASLFNAPSDSAQDESQAAAFAATDGSEASADRAAGEEGTSAFDFEAPPDLPESEKPDLGPAHGARLSTIGAVTSTASFESQAPTATGGLNLAELDRRIALLETRLEEVIDAKDRLERQVSAQTEELRVQRAAIARTQRVLRTVVRPDDEPSEPALKS